MPSPVEIATRNTTEAIGLRGPLLGRLDEIWQLAQDDGPRLVFLAGPAGIGKTRCARRFAADLGDRALLVPGVPLATGLQRAASHLLANEVKAPPGHGVGDGEGAALLLAHSLLRAAWRLHGLCVVLEDEHEWSETDARTARFLWSLARQHGAPLMLAVTTRRTDPRDSALLDTSTEDETGHVSAFALPPLDPEETAALARDLLKTDDLPLPLASWLHERTEGHPHYALELLRFLMEGGALERSGTVWHFAPPEAEILPADMQATVDARLVRARDDEETWPLLATLAVLARSVPLAEWSALADVPRELMAELTGELIRLGLVTGGLQSGVAHYSLAHASYPASLRGMLGRSERKRLHRTIAERSTRPGERAYHARMCSHQLALPWTRRALEDARARFDHAAVEGHARALLEAGAPAGPETSLLLAEALYGQGKFAEVDLLLGDHVAPDALLIRAQSLHRLARSREALALAQAGLSALTNGISLAPGARPDSTDPNRAGAGETSCPSLAARFQVLIARLLIQLGRAAEAEGLICELQAGAPVDSYERALALLEQGRLDHLAHRYGAALSASEQAATILRNTGDVAELCRALNNVGIFASLLGRWDTSEAALSECLALSEARGDGALLASRHLNLGNLYNRRGRYGPAVAAYSSALRLAHRHGDLEVKATALLSLAEVRLLQGDSEGAVTLYRDGIELLRTLGDDSRTATYDLALAHAEAMAGMQTTSGEVSDRPETAGHPLAPLLEAELMLLEHRYAECVASLTRLDTSGVRNTAGAHALLTSGLLMLRQQRTGEARDSALQALAIAREQQHLPLQGQALVQLALTARLDGDEPTARRLAREGIELLDGCGGLGHLLLMRRLHPEEIAALSQGQAGADDSACGAGAVFLRTLGRFEIEANGCARPWRARKARDLLAMLVVAGLREEGGGVARQAILAALWPEANDRQAELSFRTTLKRLRDALGDNRTVTRTARGEYRLAGVRSDAEVFLIAHGRGDRETAFGWYGGEFLPGVDVPGVDDVREELRSRYLSTVRQMVPSSEPRRRMELNERLLAEDPFDLEALLDLLSLLDASGARARRLRLIAKARRRFLDELGEIPGELDGASGQPVLR